MKTITFPELPNQSRQYYSQGLSILELLISMAIGVFILAGATHFFQNAKYSQTLQTELVNMRENAHFAFSTIEEDIRLAGFYGCSTRWDETLNVNTLNSPNSFQWNFSRNIEGSENTDGASTWSPDISIASVKSNAMAGTDTLTVRRAEREDYPVIATQSGATADLTVPANSLSESDFVMVTNCNSSSIFQITNASPSAGTISHAQSVPSNGPGNSTANLGRSYATDANVMELSTITYYIRANAQGIPSLYRVINFGNSEEVIEGIEDLQVEYGVDQTSDNSVDAYQTAAQVEAASAWDNVLSVRLGISARSINDTIGEGNQPIEYAFTADINLRNKLP